jgi:hypothetical protein
MTYHLYFLISTLRGDRPSCHELKSVYKWYVHAAHFWIEGVGVFVLGIFGLAGNILTIVTLSLIKSNKNFNKLLVIRLKKSRQTQTDTKIERKLKTRKEKREGERREKQNKLRERLK